VVHKENLQRMLVLTSHCSFLGLHLSTGSRRTVFILRSGIALVGRRLVVSHGNVFISMGGS
jgi:hypothetical protein